MLLAIAVLAVAQTPAQAPEAGGQKNTLMGIYRELAQHSQKGGMDTSSLLFTSLGYSEWSAIDGGLKGVPCKIYRADGIWSYEQKDPKKGVDHHTASFRSICYVGLDGMPIRSESAFRDDCEFKKNIDIFVVTQYYRDHYWAKVTRNGASRTFEMEPKFGMAKFGGMHQPMIQDGLVQSKSREGAFISPYTGMPCEYSIQIAGRFRGTYFFEPQEGYYLDVTSPSGTQRAFVTRQGQLLKVELGNKLDATLQVGMTRDQWGGWGTFDLGNWDVPATEANPNRPHFKTLGLPILLKDPHLLFLVPCVVAI